VNQLASAPSGADAPKVNVINFTIKTAYTPSKAAPVDGTVAVSAPGQPSAPAQVAKN
jgi:hypothetical protein